MKTLILARHGKAESKSIGEDFSRDLVNKGREEVTQNGLALKKDQYKTDVCISSPANRALQTAEILFSILGIRGNIILKPKIYEASLSDLQSVIEDISDEYNTVLITGHNPAFELAVGHFTNQYGSMPTGGIAVIEFPFENWRMVSGGIGELRKIYFTE